MATMLPSVLQTVSKQKVEILPKTVRKVEASSNVV